MVIFFLYAKKVELQWWNHGTKKDARNATFKLDEENMGFVPGWM